VDGAPGVLVLAMPMPPYPILCYRKGCQKPAVYKIAAQWSDGITRELKTYALTCADCLAEFFYQSRRKQQACRLTPGEILEPPGIFRMVRGQRDRVLERLSDLEEQLIREGPGSKPGS
jgi:hypothetical protein